MAEKFVMMDTAICDFIYIVWRHQSGEESSLSRL